MLPPFDPWCSGALAAAVIHGSRASAGELERRRQSRLEALLDAARGSRFYRRHLGDMPSSSLRLADLPVVRKADLMSHFDDWVTDPALDLDALRRFTADRSRIADPFLGRYVVWESSGSSGEPGLFVQDAAAMAVYDALEAWRRPVLQPLRRWLDPFGMSERIAFVGALDGHFASTVSIERLRRLNATLCRTVHSLSFLQPIRQLTAELEALRPTVIATYPTLAVLLADEARAGRLALSPSEIWTGGETLTPPMRSRVQATFGCPVINSYGASEFLSLACECRCGNLHLNSDWAILEPVDERGCAVPAGVAPRTTLLTNLANHVQPLIRYDLGDRVSWRPGACTCGSSLPVIDVQGRDDDVLCLGDSIAHRVSVLPLALSTVLEEEAGLFDFQLVQRGPADLLLRTALHGAAATSMLRQAHGVLAAFLAHQGAIGVHIHCRSGEAIRSRRSGKVQRVVGLPPGTALPAD